MLQNNKLVFNKNKNSIIYIILISIFIVGLYNSDISSSGGGFNTSILFLILALIFYIVFYNNFMENNTSVIILLLLINPISILMIEYLLNGYQMFNLFPFILLIGILIKGVLSELKINKQFMIDIKELYVFYMYCFISVVLTFISLYGNFDQSRYWFLILIGTIVLILSLILLNINEIKYKDIINGIYVIFILISFACICRIFIIGFSQGNLNELLKYKRLYSYPTMSTSNYTIAVLAILFIYLESNNKYLYNRRRISIYITMLLNLVISQSRGSIIAIIIMCVLCLILKAMTNFKNKERFKINIKFILVTTFILSIILIGILFTVNRLNNNEVGMNVNIIERMKRMFTAQDANISSRILYWNMYIDEFYNFKLINIVFGKGMSNQVGLEVRPHNIFILLVHQVGIIGLILFIYSIFKISHRYKSIMWINMYLIIHSMSEPLYLTVWIDSTIVILIFIEGQKYLNLEKLKRRGEKIL